MPRTLPLAALALGLTLAWTIPSAQAHNVWLQPSSTVLSKAQWITVDAAVSNDLFFFNHMPLALDNLTVSAPNGDKVAVDNLSRGKLRSVFDVNLAQPGTYRLAVVNHGVMGNYKLNGEAKRFRGGIDSYAKDIPAGATELRLGEQVGRIETFVTVGKPSPLKPSGVGLEMVPVAPSHPNDLVAGEAASFRFLVDGKPAAGIEVALVRGQTRYRNQVGETRLTTDADGKIAFTWPEAGMYWLEAEVKDKRTTVKDAAERRLTYAVTLEVLPQ